MANEIAHNSEASAAVSRESLVQLYSTDERTILVPEADLERWMAEGWSREPFDVTEAVAEALLQFNVARDLFSESVKAVEGDGEIDPQDESQWATFEAAFAALSGSVVRVRAALWQIYPIREGAAVPLVNEDLPEGDPLREIVVDPKQVGVYLEQGYVSA